MGQAVTGLPLAERVDRLTRANFDDLVAQYEKPLLRFLYAMVHDPELAADLCQDTFLSAYRAAPALTRDLNVAAWLYTIALNHARGVMRRRRVLSWVPFALGRHDRPIATVDAGVRAAQRDELRELLQQLPVEQRACLLLHAEGFRYGEIARILNCSVGAVKLRMLRARERCLRLSAQGEEDL